MKTKKFIICCLTAISTVSCVSSYYQVYQTETTSGITKTDKFLVYENNNLEIIYNLWENKGNIGFVFYNKCDSNIYVNLEDCFFIMNGEANNYYKNRTFTTSKSASLSTNRTNSKSRDLSSSVAKTGINYLDLIQTNRIGLSYNNSFSNSLESTTLYGNSISYMEEKIICIPPKTYKSIFEYNINNKILRHCDLFLYPTKYDINTVKFNKSESPLIFANHIAYKIGKSGAYKIINNEFFISEVTNYPESEISILKYDEFCGRKNQTQSKYFKESKPDRFYLKYLR